MRGAFPGEDAPGHDPIGHLELAANCDAFLVAPASANTVAKLAGGFADSMLTTSFLACTAPRLLAPAMNDRMYADAATQANLETLRERGVEVIEPGEGAARLARRARPRPPARPGRAAGPGREPCCPAGARPWDGLRVLVTAGGTREPIDPVRFIGNRSSGRMGIALAEAAARRGAEVTLIAANVALPAPPGVRRIDVETTAELERAADRRVRRRPRPADGRRPRRLPPRAAAAEKLTRDGSPRAQPRADRGHPRRPRRHPRRRARRSSASPPSTAATPSAEPAPSSARKGADLIVLNDVSDPRIGFESNENAVTLISSSDETALSQAPKQADSRPRSSTGSKP